jgi:hypothetical protein
MAYQDQREIRVAYKRESAFGTLADASGADIFRVNTGGIMLAKAPINSGENRQDKQRLLGRHGTRSVSGAYTSDLSVGSFDDLLESALRGTWSAALTIDEAASAMASATLSVGASSIVASAGSWITAGLRVGDIIRLGDGFVTANRNRNLRITGLTATTITVAETLSVEAGPLAAYDVVRARKVIMAAAPTAHSYTIEEYEQQIDSAEVFLGCRLTRLRLQMAPNGMVTVETSFMGQDMDTFEATNAPYFTSPTETTSLGLVTADAVVLYDGASVIDLTEFDITIDLAGQAQPVVGNNLTPDIWTGQADVTGTITALREDLEYVADQLAETQLSLHVMMVENDSEPKDFLALHVPLFTLPNVQKSALGQNGPRTQKMTMMIGRDGRGGAYDPTMVKLITSAAP